jgi:hypothetical protein
LNKLDGAAMDWKVVDACLFRGSVATMRGELNPELLKRLLLIVEIGANELTSTLKLRP